MLGALQAALQDNLRTARELHRKAEEVVAASVEALLEVDMDEQAAVAYLKEATPGILRWRACLPVCLPARPPARLPACLVACMPACMPDWLAAWQASGDVHVVA